MRSLPPILVFLALGCSSSGETPERSNPPPEEAGEPAPRARFEGIGRFLPHPALAGFRQHGEVRYFGETSLFEYIDGAADGFLEYGFLRLATTEYVPEASVGGSPRTVTVEIYDMGTPAGAFGKWSRIASEQGDPVELASRIVEIGGGAIRGSADLVFWKDRYLVKLTYLDEDPNATEERVRAASREVLGRMATTVAEGLPGTTSPPDEIGRLPPDGLLSHSAVHYARDVLSREGLGPGWRAWYDRDGKRVLLVLAGRAAWDALRGSEGAALMGGLGDEAVSFRDPVLGDVVLARKGEAVALAGDPDLPDLPKADAAAKIGLVREALAR